MSTWVKIHEAAQKAGMVSDGLVYSWVTSDKVPSRKDSAGVLEVDLEATLAHAAARRKVKFGKGARRVKVKSPRPSPREARIKKPKVKRVKPATERASDVERMAAVLAIYFPDGLPPDQYPDALLLVLAIERMAT